MTQPVLHYRDTGLTPGSSHTYTYQAYDGTHSTAKSPASAPVTVASTSPSQTYQQTVLADNPSFLWPLNDTRRHRRRRLAQRVQRHLRARHHPGRRRPVHRHHRHLRSTATPGW